jgi:asparagine synthase (glutamine-hydrolysing)
MCGITGAVGDFSRTRERHQQMLRALSHRGPDDEGVYDAPGVLLGHRRLSIIDLALGHQPIIDDATKCAMVFNGEIYNYQDLRRDLEADGVVFGTTSDTEVLLRLYVRDGIRCLGRLRGMFAFAIWDPRTQTLFAARDHLGQKPLYYHHSKDGLLFASEIKALLAFDPGLREVRAEALDQYLSLRFIGSPLSMFERVSKLPPAHYLVFNAGSLRVEPYWKLDYEPKQELAEEAALDELESRLIEALRLHMVSDVPVGALLSGGMDSGLICALLQKHVVKEPLQTFTMGIPLAGYDESPFARATAQAIGSQHREFAQVPSLIDHLADLVWHLDEPSDPLSVCAYAISAQVRKHVKVVIGGDGGDEMFGGYDRYYGNQYATRYAHVPEWVRKYGVGPLLSMLPDGRWYKSRAHQLKWLHRLSFYDGGQRYARSLNYFYFEETDRHRLYSSRMRERLAGATLESPIARAFDSAHAREELDRMLSADLDTRLPDHPVMITDRMTMAHGLEARSPFMDHELAQFVARLPTSLKVRGRTLRYLQRKLASRYLPEKVLTMPKQGFASALPYLLADEYRVMFDAYLRGSSRLVSDGWLNRAPMEALLSEHLSGARDHGNRLWLLLNSELWYRMHVLGQDRNELADELRDLRKAPAAVAVARVKAG